MLNITPQSRLIPLLEEACKNKHGLPLTSFLADAVGVGLFQLSYMSNSYKVGTYYLGGKRDYKAIAADPDVSDWLRCYAADNERLASSWHVSELKPRSCLRKLAAPLLGVKPEKEFSAYATLTALVGDWLHQALQELMLEVPELIPAWYHPDVDKFLPAIELDLKRAELVEWKTGSLEYREQFDALNLGCRIDMEGRDEWTGDIKTNCSEKWSNPDKHKWDVDKYGYQVVLGGHFTQSNHGVILEVCRDTFKLQEWRVAFDYRADAFKRDIFLELKEANKRVAAGRWPEPKPGPGYEACWSCPANVADLCTSPEKDKHRTKKEAVV
jgi:hypothetical protein